MKTTEKEKKLQYSIRLFFFNIKLFCMVMRFMATYICINSFLKHHDANELFLSESLPFRIISYETDVMTINVHHFITMFHASGDWTAP